MTKNFFVVVDISYVDYIYISSMLLQQEIKISRFGRFHENFTLKEGTVPLPFSMNRPENHSHNLRKALGERLGLLKTGSLSLSLSLSPLSLSLSLLSLPPSL